MGNAYMEKQKKMQRVIENEEAMAKLRAGLREVKLQLRIALSPVLDAICDFLDKVITATEEADDGK